jgi:hypothetical protein
MTKNNFIEFLIKSKKRKDIYDLFISGIERVDHFKECIDYIIDEKIEIFDYPVFNAPIFDDEYRPIELVIPTFRRVWVQVYQDPPTLFMGVGDKRLELFQLYFDIDFFLEYLKEIFIKTKTKLEDFEYIDRTVKVLEIITDNYIAMLVKKTLECQNHEKEIRELKLKKILK